MHIKDYYRILEIPANATVADIKKSYRRLAMLFHPDHNPKDSFAAARFLEIKEAYNLLIDEKKRRKYDEECWLRGLNQKKNTVTNSALQIKQEVDTLNIYLNKIDTYRMNCDALLQYINQLLSDSNIATLIKDNQYNNTIVPSFLTIISQLKHSLAIPIMARLRLLAQDNDMLLTHIEQTESLKKLSFRKKLRFRWLMASLLIFFCIIAYFILSFF